MNPEVKKLRERTLDYKQKHPRYAGPAPEPLPRRKKLHTRERMTGKEVCFYCGKKLSTYTATQDHLIPISRGGTNSPHNLVWCCKKCNHAKGSKLITEWEV